MTVPDKLKYTASHQWLRAEADGMLTVGITFHAQEQLGDVVFVQHPDVGRKVKRGEACALVESVKTASEIPAPVSGEIVATNPAVSDHPEQLNRDPYAAWLFRIRPLDLAELGTLLDAPAYLKIVTRDS